MIWELRQVVSVRVEDTTYLAVSLKNGAPGSSAAVRADQAGSNIWYVVRPSKMPSLALVTCPITSPMPGSKPKAAVQDGASITPSRLMNSCTRIGAMLPPVPIDVPILISLTGLWSYRTVHAVQLLAQARR